jgi:hypothetical protein
MSASMRVAGLELAASAVAELAQLLHEAGERDLAHRVGIAIDTNQQSFRFGWHELPLAIGVLDDPPDDLAELRDALIGACRGR